MQQGRGESGEREGGGGRKRKRDTGERDAEQVIAREVGDGLLANYKLATWLFYHGVNWVEIF